MVSQTPPIIASLLNVPSSDIPFDRGVVATQIDASTYIIRLPSEDLTVRVPPGALMVGSSVAVACRGDEVSIAVNALPGQSLTAFDDTLELRVGPEMTELLTLLKELRNSVLSSHDSVSQAHLIAQAIELLEQKQHDISSLVLLFGQLKQELFSSRDPMLSSVKQESAQRITELLAMLTRKLSGPAGAGEESPTRAITLSQAPPRGLYYVKSADEALALLTRYAPAAESEATEVLRAYTGKSLFLLFYESAAGGEKVLVMPQELALLEIEHILRTEMKSDAMRHLDPNLITDMVMQKGKLTLSHLVDCDMLLQSVSAKEQSSLIQGEAFSISLPQLVAVALEAGDTRIPDFYTALMLVGSRMPDLVRDIVTWLETNRQVKLVDLRNIVFTGLSADQIFSGSREEALPSLFRNAGFSLEHDLYESVMNRGTDAPALQRDSPSLKLALLIILGYLNSLADGRETEAEGVRKGPPTQRTVPAHTADPASASQSRGTEVQRGDTLSIEAVRQQVAMVLDRLESLQMMAKPITSVEGEQQVLVLPVRVDDEWTEVRVKFVKKRRGRRKGKTARHVSVHLTMDLTRLGAITAFMEYHAKRNLQISLTLENALAREWFEEHRRELRDALIGIGIPVVDLTITDKNVRKEKIPYPPPAQAKPVSRFDVRG